MAVVGVSQLLYLLDQAFDGPDWHSLIANVQSLTAEAWLWIPEGGSRSSRDIVEHVGACKIMYHNHAFGDAQRSWDDPELNGGAALASPESAIVWLREQHGPLRHSIALLDDAELLRPRRTNWGELKETRWIIATMIQHDLYHAGEINHIRSLHGQADRWAFESE